MALPRWCRSSRSWPTRRRSRPGHRLDHRAAPDCTGSTIDVRDTSEIAFASAVHGKGHAPVIFAARRSLGSSLAHTAAGRSARRRTVPVIQTAVDVPGGRLKVDVFVGKAGLARNTAPRTTESFKQSPFMRWGTGRFPANVRRRPADDPYRQGRLAYVLSVFAAAFVIGAVRVTLVAPLTGPLLAVALEVPLVLALSWVVAGRVLQRWPLTGRPAPWRWRSCPSRS